MLCIPRYLLNLPLILMMLFLFTSCKKENIPQEYTKESTHFLLHGSSEVATNVDADKILEKSEILFPDLLDFLGESFRPENKINIWLEGDMIDKGSYVDFDGIHLYRYNAVDGGYLAVLAHEMTHAFIAPWFIDMEAWSWPTYRFFDEGFAEYVAQKVDSLKQGFPFYGFQEDVVAGDLVVTNTYISFDTLRKHHDELNDKCNLQAYPQRASWMRHLDETFGRNALLSVVFPDEEPTNNVVKDLIGVDLMELDSLWKTWIIPRFNSVDGAQVIAESFHQRTAWYKLCE